jgi:hypothetical protein
VTKPLKSWSVIKLMESTVRSSGKKEAHSRPRTEWISSRPRQKPIRILISSLGRCFHGWSLDICERDLV